MSVADVRLDEIRERLRGGETLPTGWYTDPTFFEVERERIFERTWQFVGYAEDVVEPGQYLTGRVAGRVPVAVVRGDDGELRALVNVCRHRGAQLLDGCGTARAIRCPYHAWRYDLAGTLLTAPRVPDDRLDRESLRLLPAAVGVWGPLVFVNLDTDAPALDVTIEPIASALEPAGVDFRRLRRKGRTEFPVRANWKIVAENFLECYHCPVAHPGLTKLIKVDAESYALRREGHALMASAPVREAVRQGLAAPPYDLRGAIEQPHFHLLFPSTTFNVMPGTGNLLVYSWTPVSPTRTEGAFEYLVGDDMTPETERRLTAFLDIVGHEDVELVERVQRGLDSGAVPAGRLISDSEDLVRSFQELVVDSIA